MYVAICSDCLVGIKTVTASGLDIIYMRIRML